MRQDDINIGVHTRLTARPGTHHRGSDDVRLLTRPSCDQLDEPVVLALALARNHDIQFRATDTADVAGQTAGFVA